MQKPEQHSSTSLELILIYVGLVVVMAGLLWSSSARANGCAMSLPGISSTAAAEYRMRATPAGYILDTASLARRNGGAGPLLDTVEEQIAANMTWFSAMEAIVVDPSTPRLADVQALYERGVEAHEIQLSIARSLRCQLNITGAPQQRPSSIASLRTSSENRSAQARKQQDAKERGQANSRSFWEAVGTISNVLHAVGSSMRSAPQSTPAGRQDTCGWVPYPGGGGYCELGHGG